jgi:uncharacterized membrane protein
MSGLDASARDSPTPRWVQVAAVLYGLPFVWVGIQHFVSPEIFEPIVPPWLGWPWFWVHITGYTEVALGIGVMIPRSRRLACWLMVAQLALLYLANLHMWLADVPFQGIQMGMLGHLVRLGVQLLLIAAAVGLARSASEPRNEG